MGLRIYPINDGLERGMCDLELLANQFEHETGHELPQDWIMYLNDLIEETQPGYEMDFRQFLTQPTEIRSDILPLMQWLAIECTLIPD